MYKISLVTALTVLALIGCGGGGSSSPGGTTTTTGTLIDNIISGVKYINGTSTGYTDSNGQFPYTGGLVKFYVGNIKIGELNSLPSDNRIFVQDLVGVSRTDTSDPRVQQIGSFLQSLDSDPSTEEIELTQTDFDKFNSLNDDIANLDVSTILPNAGFSSVRSNTKAKRHMDNVLKYYGIIADSTAPTVASSIPANSATGVALNSNIVVTFSEDMPREQMTSSNIVLKDSSNNTINTTISFEWNTLTITPSSNLLANETYTLTLDSSLKDFANNSLGTNTNISFDTVLSDTTPPTISSSTPTNNDVNIGVSDNLTITFDEEVDVSTINDTNIVLRKVSDNSVIGTNVSYDNSTKTATVNPNVDLTDDTFYSLTVTTGVTDTSTNAFASNQTIDFMVGEDITHLGYSYKVLKSPITGKNWLDRNLGAYSVCTKSRDDASFVDDAAYVADQQDCFGDYYQWGRLADGHQEAITDAVNTPNKTVFNTTATRSTSYSNVGHGDFITNSSSPYDWTENTTQDTNNVDDDGSLRTAQWSKTDGTSVCPISFRVPSFYELAQETSSVTDRNTAFTNFLKFPSSGYVNNTSGNNGLRGVGGYLWTNSTNAFFFHNSGAMIYGGFYKSEGLSIRCIKD
ncbi:Ig-like domain-containing protein [Halarcobacter sp.]|uniref:Ig-like domain-containing protein n=1 Tax=Halarcobacter sp. TaxID=2321133 RepID=UPI002AAB38B2|nr:Ig-like domain-containing protein [Halarcobacter sp.]